MENILRSNSFLKSLFLEIFLNKISFFMVMSYPSMDISLPGSGPAFLHYDWVICGEINKLTYKNQLQDNLNAMHQIEFIIPEYFSVFARNKIIANRKAIYLVPTNLTQLEKFISDIIVIYKIKSNQKFDPRLYTFIRWPEIEIDNDDDRKNEILKKIKHMFSGKLYLSNKVYIIIPPSNDSDESKFPEAFEIYSISQQTILQSIVHCQNLEDYECYTWSIISRRRNNFQNTLIKGIGVDHPFDQLAIRYSRLNGTLKFSGGLAVQLLWDLRDFLNFTVQAMVADDYISEHPNGTLGGMGTYIYEGSADIAIVMSYFLIYRVQKLTPLFPMSSDKITAYFRQPRASTKKNIYTSPFNDWVWLLIFFIGLLIIISIYIFSWMGYPAHGNYEEQRWESEESILWFINTICQRSWYISQPSMSTKLIALTVLVGTLICSSAYSGGLIAGLAVETEPVNNLSDLVSNGFKFLYNPIVFYRYFHTVECPTYGFEVQLRSSNHCTTDESGILKVFQGGFAFVTTEDVIGPAYQWANCTDQQMCEMISKVSFGDIEIPSGFYIQKGSPLKEVFNLKLLQVMESGLNHRYWKIIYLKEQSMSCTSKHKSLLYRGGLDIDDVFLASLFAIISLPLALFFLCIEYLIAYPYRRRKARLFAFLNKEIWM